MIRKIINCFRKGAILAVMSISLMGCGKKNGSQTAKSLPSVKPSQAEQPGVTALPSVAAASKADEDPYKYVVLMYTNKRYDEVKSYLPEMAYLFGNNDPSSKKMYAYGLPGPMLLTQSTDEMTQEINACFDMAEKYNIPVYFQLDDVTNYTTYFGSGAKTKFYEDPSMCEWIAFPEKGESYGGEKKYGELPRFWFNWGSWMCAEAFPNLASEKLQNFVVNQLKTGVLEPLTARLKKLKEMNKEYLFAGVCVGWETHIPDYSCDNPLISIDHDNPPADSRTGRVMQEWEMAAYGYGALHSLGYDQARLEKEAKEKSINVVQLRKQLLYQVIHDYSELLSKTIYDAGIPRTKIFTHTVSYSSYSGIDNTFTPPIWCAVNDYSIPGYTMSPVTCKYDLSTMKQAILTADPDMPYFSCAEGYAAGLNEETAATKYFNDLFGKGALVVTAFGYGDPPTQYFTFERTRDFGYIKAVRKWLGQSE